MKVVSRVWPDHPPWVCFAYVLTVALLLTVGGCHQRDNSSSSASTAAPATTARSASTAAPATTTETPPTTVPSTGGCDAKGNCHSGGYFGGPGPGPGWHGCGPGVGC